MEQIFQVEGMHCQGCVASVQRAVTGVAGVSSVVVDLATGAVRVDFDRALVAAPAIVEAIEAAGYDVT